MQDKIVHIIGAGPAGLTAAIHLADARYFLHRIGIDVNFLFSPFQQGTFWDPTLSPHNIKTKRPLFYLIERGVGVHSLDQGLKRQAMYA